MTSSQAIVEPFVEKPVHTPSPLHGSSASALFEPVKGLRIITTAGHDFRLLCVMVNTDFKVRGAGNTVVYGEQISQLGGGCVATTLQYLDMQGDITEAERSAFTLHLIHTTDELSEPNIVVLV